MKQLVRHVLLQMPPRADLFDYAFSASYLNRTRVSNLLVEAKYGSPSLVIYDRASRTYRGALWRPRKESLVAGKSHWGRATPPQVT